MPTYFIDPFKFGVAANWWNDLTNIVAVYQPKGAASLAASYVNLVNPGTNDAAPGTAPTWNATDGWIFLATSSQYLTTGIVPTVGYSMMVRFSNATKSPDRLIGVFGAVGSSFIIQTSNAGNTQAFYHSGTNAGVAPRATSGVLAIAGGKAYRDGVDEGITLTGAVSVSGAGIYIGDVNGSSSFFTGHIQAVAICSSTQTAQQIADVSAAMAAL